MVNVAFVTLPFYALSDDGWVNAWVRIRPTREGYVPVFGATVRGSELGYPVTTTVTVPDVKRGGANLHSAPPAIPRRSGTYSCFNIYESLASSFPVESE